MLLLCFTSYKGIAAAYIMGPIKGQCQEESWTSNQFYTEIANPSRLSVVINSRAVFVWEEAMSSSKTVMGWYFYF